MQHNYFTPIKNVYSHSKKSNNTDMPQRDGDWVCFNCQNLNYSFRKTCNRCKTQTREENQVHSVYSFYYLPKMVQPMNNINPNNINSNSAENNVASFSANSGLTKSFEYCQENKQNTPYETNQCLETPKKKKALNSPTHSKLDGLPSVSPLVKKYRQKEHHTTLSKIKNCRILQSSAQDQFQNIQIKDFDEMIQQFNLNGKQFDSSPFKQFVDEQDNEGSKFMRQIQESISKIII